KALLVQEVVRDKTAAQLPLLRQRVAALRDKMATRVTLLDAQGTVLADSHEEPERMENHADRPEVQEAGGAPFGTATRHSQTLGQDLMYLAMATGAPDQAVATVRVALPLSAIQEQLAGLRRLVWTAAGLTVLAALVLAFWLTRRTTLPLQE